MKIIGHRGAAGYEPENTIRSIETAIAMGADAVEIDIQLSRDGEPVVIHDPTLERTTDGLGRVDEYSLAQLRRLDAGKGERIPTLADVVESIGRRIPLHIELKAPGSATPVAALLRDRYGAGWTPDDFTISSFSLLELRGFRALLPSTSIAFLTERRSLYLAPAVLIGADGLHLCVDTASDAMVSRAQGVGMSVRLYTANDEKDFARARELHADGIFTDYPDRALRYLKL